MKSIFIKEVLLALFSFTAGVLSAGVAHAHSPQGDVMVIRASGDINQPSRSAGHYSVRR